GTSKTWSQTPPQICCWFGRTPRVAVSARPTASWCRSEAAPVPDWRCGPPRHWRGLGVGRGRRCTVTTRGPPPAKRRGRRGGFATSSPRRGAPRASRGERGGGTPASQAITEPGRHHGVPVLGAYADASRSSVLVGSRLAKTVEALPGTVIVAKSSRAIPPIFVDEPAPPIMVSGADVSTVVDKW